MKITKGVPNGRIIKVIKTETHVKEYHATKGWRVYRR